MLLNERLQFGHIFLLLLIGLKGSELEPINLDFELHPQDGWYNNLIHPDWGAIDGQLLRKSKNAYSDGVYMPSGQDRPNPFEISLMGHDGPSGLGSLRNRTAFMVFFGQQVVEEILDAQTPGCPREFFNIPFKPNVTQHLNPNNTPNLELPLFRTRFDQRTGISPNNPRQQLNEITPFIDGNLVYGSGKAWTDSIRELDDRYPGRLKALDPTVNISNSFPAMNDIKLPMANPPPPREHAFKNVGRFWRLGNPRGNENPFLLSFGVLWFRYHNFIANKYASEHRNLTDEQVFNLARKWIIAVYQKLVFYDWLPSWLGLDENSHFKINISAYDDVNGRYRGYDPNVHPGIAQEFQSAAFRFGHTLVTPGTWIRDQQCNFKPMKLNIPGQPNTAHALRLCNSFWNPQEFLQSSDDAYDNLLMGLMSTLTEREDNIVVPDLRKHVFGPLEFSRRDLVAVNIQRARDHGLPDYNSVRVAYGLPRVESWEDINNHTHNNSCYMCEPIQRLKVLYGNTSAPDNLDLFSGGLLETTPDGPGILFRTIILDQFLRIRHGDRFWFENRANGLFTDKEIDQIMSTTVLDVVLNVTNIERGVVNQNPFIHRADDPCPQPQQLAADTGETYNNTIVIENCTKVGNYDYFSGSQYSFALTFFCIGLCIPGTIAVMLLMAHFKKKRIVESQQWQTPNDNDVEANTHLAVEWMGPKEGERNVKIKFDEVHKKIHISDQSRRPLRVIDLRYITCSDATPRPAAVHIRLSNNNNQKLMSVRVPGEIDLVLKFVQKVYRTRVVHAVNDFLHKINVRLEQHEMAEAMILKDTISKEQRKKLLDQFFRIVCLQTFNTSTKTDGLKKLDAETANKISRIQLTRAEFAEALGLKSTSKFVKNMFEMVDKDGNGLVGFREFLGVFAILAQGGADEKANMLFNMYDLRGRGELTFEQFTKMIKSMLDLSDTSLDTNNLNDLVLALYSMANLNINENIKIDTFKRIFASGAYETVLGMGLQAQLPGSEEIGPQRRQAFEISFNKSRNTFMQSFGGPKHGNRSVKSQSFVAIKTHQKEKPKSLILKHWYSFSKYVENYRRQIFWVTLYVLISIGIFVERAYYYSVEREQYGLRRLAGYGVSATRGAAAGMMWTYSCLLITMARNTITFLRETFLHQFIPFDSFHTMHRLIAIEALIFTLIHVIGHAINFYHIATWPSIDLNCIFREYFRATDAFASFHYWAWATITGLTGIFLTLILIVMYVFAIPYARRHLFGAFWFTHAGYILVYILMIMHGSGRLVQSPLTQNYLIGPLVVFVIDKLVSFSRRKIEISVKKVELLPSDVLGLTFKRPGNFEYKSGQWVRISCLELGSSEYHPFTLTSAPHEEHLSLHIRAIGPWTKNMRQTYDVNNRNGKPFPKLYIDGPFGEGHQDWYRFKVAVLVGGGIGVTPFASILKDIVFTSKLSARRVPCEKVYFLWITRTQKQFEWLTDIIRDVERDDLNNLVSVHIFITQFQQKFDLRTTMLYICERHFQKISGMSLFTGLKATTHFGRPQFEEFFKSLHTEHPAVGQVGVFSCGPPPMTRQVDRACSTMNAYENYPTFTHHSENF